MSNSIGAWSPGDQPNNPDEYAIDADFLSQISQFDENQLADIGALFTPEQLQQHAALMQLSGKPWAVAADKLTSDTIKQLIKFFTLAEVQLADWHGGDKSPVIWLVKILKQRGEFPDKPLTLWIRANTSNRFLPHGNAL